MAPHVTLTTDFGGRDPYVASMKGVIAAICPAAAIFDLTHEIAPQDVSEAALFLASAIPFFPTMSIHVVVVDPGVGTSRRAICVRAGGQYFICPDNGLLTLYLERFEMESAYCITEARYARKTVSPTFHGRDIFAPAAAHLAAGISAAALGPPLDDIIKLNRRAARREGEKTTGEIVHVDRFGNAISNIHESMLGGEKQVRCGDRAFAVRTTYGEVAKGQSLALVGSMGYLEVAVNGGSAAREFAIARGDAIEVTP